MREWLLELIKLISQSLRFYTLMAWRTKDFWLRALLCWGIGIALLASEDSGNSSNYDLRLKARGQRTPHSKIAIIDLNERDWPNAGQDGQNVLRPLKELVTISDSFFWSPSIWEKLLSRILAANPRAVGITPFFGDNVRSQRLPPQSRQLFEDPRVIWGADIDNNGRILVPLFATTYNSNTGLRGLRADDDGTVRRFVTSRVQVPNLAVRLASVADPRLNKWVEEPKQHLNTINYVGDRLSFKVISARDLLEGRIDPTVFSDTVVLIGNLDSNIEKMQTPLGRMSRTEILANITDNLLSNQSLTRWPLFVYFTLLAILMAASIWVLVTYPQSVALVVFTLAATLWLAFSTWAFDEICLWIPVLSPLAQLLATCIVFLSYQLAINERRTWSLEQEQKYLSEIEQLKTNFVSMMSHDLKTPIAKIQAICDRLLSTHHDAALAGDLRSLRRSSDELHRYIQSILQVTKVEAKDFRIQKEVTDINEMIDKVMQRLRPLAFEKGIELETRLEPMFSIEVDTTLIQEVIHNLVENAIKYTPAASAEHPAEKVVITSQEKDDKVVVVIEDTGPGIDPEDQKNIWGKFTRGRQHFAGGAEVKGTGLGLYLVKYFIELHGGQVFLESTPGLGTKVGFSIPIQSENDSNFESNIDPNGEPRSESDASSPISSGESELKQA